MAIKIDNNKSVGTTVVPTLSAFTENKINGISLDDKESINRMNRYDNIISNFMATISKEPFKMGEKEYNKYTKYNVYPSQSFTEEELNKQRAKNQGWMEQMGYSFAQILENEFGLGTIIGFVDIADAVYNGIADAYALTQGQEHLNDFENPVTKVLNEWKDKNKERLEIYRENPNESFALGDTGWWFDNFVSVGTTLSLLIPSTILAKAPSAISKGLRASKINKLKNTIASSNKAEEINKANKILERINNKDYSRLNKINGIKEVTTAAFLSRTMENWQEGREVYKDVYNSSLERYKKLSDKDKEEFFKNNPDLVGLSDEDIAKNIADTASMKTFWEDYWMLLMDIPQYKALSSLWKGVPNAMLTPRLSIMNKNAAKAFTKQDGTNKLKTLVSSLNQTELGKGVIKGTEEGMIKNGILNRTKELLKHPLTFATILELKEGIEEGFQGIQSEKGKELAELIFNPEFSTRSLNSYLTDGKIWEQAFWGVIGGIAFQGGGRALGNIYNKIDTKIEEKKLSDDFVKTDYAKYKLTNEKQRELEILNRASRFNDLIDKLKIIEKGENPFSIREKDPRTREEHFEYIKEEEKESFKNKAILEFLTNLTLDATDVGNYELLKEFVNSNEFNQALNDLGLNTEFDKYFSSTLQEEMDNIYNTYLGFINEFSKFNIGLNPFVTNIIARESTRTKLNINSIEKTLSELENEYYNTENSSGTEKLDNARNYYKYIYYLQYIKELDNIANQYNNLYNSKQISKEAYLQYIKDINQEINLLRKYTGIEKQEIDDLNLDVNGKIIDTIKSAIKSFNRYINENNLNIIEKTDKINTLNNTEKQLLDTIIYGEFELLKQQYSLPLTKEKFNELENEYERHINKEAERRFTNAINRAIIYINNSENPEIAADKFLYSDEEIYDGAQKDRELLKFGYKTTYDLYLDFKLKVSDAINNKKKVNANGEQTNDTVTTNRVNDLENELKEKEKKEKEDKEKPKIKIPDKEQENILDNNTEYIDIDTKPKENIDEENTLDNEISFDEQFDDEFTDTPQDLEFEDEFTDTPQDLDINGLPIWEDNPVTDGLTEDIDDIISKVQILIGDYLVNTVNINKIDTIEKKIIMSMFNEKDTTGENYKKLKDIIRKKLELQDIDDITPIDLSVGIIQGLSRIQDILKEKEYYTDDKESNYEFNLNSILSDFRNDDIYKSDIGLFFEECDKNNNLIRFLNKFLKNFYGLEKVNNKPKKPYVINMVALFNSYMNGKIDGKKKTYTQAYLLYNRLYKYLKDGIVKNNKPRIKFTNIGLLINKKFDEFITTKIKLIEKESTYTDYMYMNTIRNDKTTNTLKEAKDIIKKIINGEIINPNITAELAEINNITTIKIVYTDENGNEYNLGYMNRTKYNDKNNTSIKKINALGFFFILNKDNTGNIISKGFDKLFNELNRINNLSDEEKSNLTNENDINLLNILSIVKRYNNTEEYNELNLPIIDLTDEEAKIILSNNIIKELIKNGNGDIKESKYSTNPDYTTKNGYNEYLKEGIRFSYDILPQVGNRGSIYYKPFINIPMIDKNGNEIKEDIENPEDPNNNTPEIQYVRENQNKLKAEIIIKNIKSILTQYLYNEEINSIINGYTIFKSKYYTSLQKANELEKEILNQSTSEKGEIQRINVNLHVDKKDDYITLNTDPEGNHIPINQVLNESLLDNIICGRIDDTNTVIGENGIEYKSPFTDGNMKRRNCFIINPNSDNPILLLGRMNKLIDSGSALENDVKEELTKVLTQYINDPSSFDGLNTTLTNLLDGKNIKTGKGAKIFEGIKIYNKNNTIFIVEVGTKKLFASIKNKQSKKLENLVNIYYTKEDGETQHLTKSTSKENKDIIITNIVNRILKNLYFKQSDFIFNNIGVTDTYSNEYFKKENGKFVIDINGKHYEYSSYGEFIIKENTMTTNARINNNDEILNFEINSERVYITTTNGNIKNVEKEETIEELEKRAKDNNGKLSKVKVKELLEKLGGNDILYQLLTKKVNGQSLIEEEVDIDLNENHFGEYNLDTDTITIGNKLFTIKNNNEKLTELVRTLIHENFHKKLNSLGTLKKEEIINELLNTFNAFNDALLDKTKESDNILKIIKDTIFDINSDKHSSLSKEVFVEEWLVESLTNPTIANYLNNKEYTKEAKVSDIKRKNKSIFQKLVDIIIKVFNSIGKKFEKIKDNSILAQQYLILSDNFITQNIKKENASNITNSTINQIDNNQFPIKGDESIPATDITIDNNNASDINNDNPSNATNHDTNPTQSNDTIIDEKTGKILVKVEIDEDTNTEEVTVIKQEPKNDNENEEDEEDEDDENEDEYNKGKIKFSDITSLDNNDIYVPYIDTNNLTPLEIAEEYNKIDSRININGVSVAPDMSDFINRFSLSDMQLVASKINNNELEYFCQ